MSPEDPVTIILLRWATWIGIGLVTLIFTVLGWLGRRQVTQWERKIRGLEDEIEALENRLRGQHDEVSDGLGELKEEIHELRSDLSS